jgi:hypothetical protein
MQIAFLYIGLLFAALGIALLVSEVKARIGATLVAGRVVGFSNGNGKSSSYYAVAEYEGPDGVRRYVESSVGSSSPLGGVGDRVTVLVHPAEPDRAVVASPLTYVIGAVIAAMGFGCCAVFFVAFRADTFSVVSACAVTVYLGYKVLSALRKTPASRDVWQKYKTAIGSSRVFTDANKSTIAWADPAALRASFVKQRQANRFAAPVLLLAGPGLLFLGWHLERRTEAFLERAVHAPGRVVRMVDSRSRNSTTYAPIVAFEADGRKFTFKDSVSSNPPSHRVGDAVEVLYDPADPADARIDRGVWNKGIPILLAAFGALLCAAGLLVLKRQSAPPPQLDPQL